MAFERASPALKEANGVVGVPHPTAKGSDGDRFGSIVIDQRTIDVEQDNHARRAYHESVFSANQLEDPDLSPSVLRFAAAAS
jgi:hypothetical protein